MDSKKIYLHRGIISSNYPENSFKGIIESINLINKKKTIANGLELDICLTKDKKLIVYHPKLLKIRPKTNTNIYNYSDLKLKNHHIFLVDELIPLIIKNSKIPFLFDLKFTAFDVKSTDIYLKYLFELQNIQNLHFVVNTAYLSKILNKYKVPYIYTLTTIRSTKAYYKNEKILFHRIKSIISKKYTFLRKKMKKKNKLLIVDKYKRSYEKYDIMYQFNNTAKKDINNLKDKDVIIDYNDLYEYKQLIK
jgi:glycerophosphoryl diester phosphodiesterase